MRHRLVLSALVASLVLGGAASAQSPGTSPDVAVSPSIGDTAIGDALASMAEGMDAIETDPDAALESCRDAWDAVQEAVAAGVPETSVDPVEQLVRTCLDRLYGVEQLDARLVQPIGDLRPADLALDRHGSAFLLDGATGAVWRTDLDTGRSRPIVEPGDGRGAGIGRARKLSMAGEDLVILDDQDHLWRWRASADPRLRLLRSPTLPGVPDDAVAMTTYLIDSDRDLYLAYVVDPAESQVWRLEPDLERPGFAALSDSLLKEQEMVGVREIMVDQSLYLLTQDGVRRYYGGRQQAFPPATPPDDGGLRPGHDYHDAVIRGGRILVHDAQWDRIVAFDRLEGTYLGQWHADDLADAVAIAITGSKDEGTRLAWVTPTGLYTAPIE